ncbi:hypothetical protein LX36DRAFT_655860 [Colletotrichum falcatum]|nr:hypothetical protein LX36DRAFT_655860 [Colletotrichum falcatum]
MAPLLIQVMVFMRLVLVACHERRDRRRARGDGGKEESKIFGVDRQGAPRFCLSMAGTTGLS